MARRRASSSISVAWPPVWPPLPSWHGLLSPIIAHAFEELGLSISLWLSGDFWHAIHVVPNVGSLEFPHGAAPKRWAHNFACFERVKQERRIVRGEHAGFFDLFVPVQNAREMRGILVAGPYATTRPTSSEIQERWQWLSGSQGRLADPAFSRYVSATLGTLTLEGPHSTAFERFMRCFSDLASDQGDATALATEADRLAKQLISARAPERMWELARAMVVEQIGRWWPEYLQSTLLSFGMDSAPGRVLVGLLSSRDAERDPVDDLLRRAAVQRACTSAAHKMGRTVCGQVGDHGVFFLVDDPGDRQRDSARLTELASQASTIARRFGFGLFAGISQAREPALLPESYRAALWAAEKALSQRTRVVRGEPPSQRSAENLGELLKQLEKSVERGPNVLSARFNRYIEAVLAQSSYRLEATRIRLEVGLERLAEPLVDGGLLDPKALRDIRRAIQESDEEARTVAEIVVVYRRLVTNIETALQRPTVARQERGTEQAIQFIRAHLAETLSLAQVAKMAGFAPSHFARLFKREAGVSFSRYVQNLRVERAKQMLRGTSFSVEQVQKLCGFQSTTHFHRTFKRAVGTTPAAYRKGRRGRSTYPWEVPTRRRR